jgi:Na+-translocating ferredoxin:NAD+ oxidoreductase RnfE subunit
MPGFRAVRDARHLHPADRHQLLIIGRAESFASKNPVAPSLLDGFMMGLGFALVLITLGALREAAGPAPCCRMPT